MYILETILMFDITNNKTNLNCCTKLTANSFIFTFCNVTSYSYENSHFSILSYPEYPQEELFNM